MGTIIAAGVCKSTTARVRDRCSCAGVMGTLFAIALTAILTLGICQVGAQNADAYATKFFLSERPSDKHLSALPPGVKDVVAAKVRIVGGISTIIGRDQSGRPPIGPPPKAYFAAWVEVTDVVSGSAETGSRIDVFFGQPGTSQKFVIPQTPKMYAREYFIVSYLANDGVRRLVGFPASREEYEQWNSEVLEYIKIRGRPGVQEK